MAKKIIFYIDTHYLQSHKNTLRLYRAVKIFLPRLSTYIQLSIDIRFKVDTGGQKKNAVLWIWKMHQKKEIPQISNSQISPFAQTLKIKLLFLIFQTIFLVYHSILPIKYPFLRRYRDFSKISEFRKMARNRHIFSLWSLKNYQEH